MSEQMLKRADIRTNGGTQSRAAINEATVAEYAEAMGDPATVFPPVVVYYDGREYWLADGFHRLAAWERIGREEVPADVRQGDRRRAILHSCAANAEHGLRRTNADKRRAVMTLLEDAEWSQWSARQIARQCGVSHDFVARIKREQEPEVSSDDTLPDNSEPAAQKSPVRKPSGTPQEADNAGESVAPTSADVSARAADDPGDRNAPLAGVAEDQDAASAKLRAEVRNLTREGLEDEVVGLRAALAEEKAKRKAAEAERDQYKARWHEATCEDMGRALGNAQRARDTAKGRLNEELAKNARQARRIKLLEAEIKALRAQVEKQQVTL